MEEQGQTILRHHAMAGQSSAKRPRISRTRREGGMFGTLLAGSRLPSSISFLPNHGSSVPGMTDLTCVQLPQRVGGLLLLTH